MKTSTTLGLTFALVLVTGCESTSRRGGGGAEDEGFKIGVPSGSTEVKQGEVKTVDIALHRGKFFKRDVTLDMNPSQGIRIDPGSAYIRASEKPEVQIRIMAPKDAALGAYVVHVKGTPAQGDPADVQFTVKVVAP